MLLEIQEVCHFPNIWRTITVNIKKFSQKEIRKKLVVNQIVYYLDVANFTIKYFSFF